MKLKSRPKKPVVVKNRSHNRIIWEGESVQSIVDSLVDIGVDPCVATIEKDREPWDQYDTVYLYWKADESDAEFEMRMKAYDTKLANYNEWYDANKVEIEKELEKRKKEDLEKQQREISALEEKLKKLVVFATYASEETKFHRDVTHWAEIPDLTNNNE